MNGKDVPHQWLHGCLARLDAERPAAVEWWGEACVMPISGGANNVLYRVTGEGADLAVKFTLRDDRDRAGREFDALCVLSEVGKHIAPKPVWLDRTSYTLPVVVQRWVDGTPLAGPPQSPDEWARVLDHYCAIHEVTPAQTRVALRTGYVNVSSGEAGKELVRSHAAQLPHEAWPESLRKLLAHLDAWSPPAWPEPTRTLVRVDGNWRNFLCCDDRLISVDWEYSGWGDPAFELSELMLHPAYEGVSQEQWDAVVDEYAQRRNEPTVDARVRVYATIMAAWWLVRWARYLYEVPRGLDARLISRPPGWLNNAQRQYNRYLAIAQACLSALP